jgi:PEP-CTERM motif
MFKFFSPYAQLERMPEMRKSLVAWFVVALAGLLVTGSVRADNIPWGYSAASTDIFNNNNPIKSSSISFAGSSGVASGDSGIIIYNLTTSSTAADVSPDSFSNVPFNLGVTFTDIKATSSASGTAKASDTLSFAGLFNANNVTTKSLLPGMNSWTSPTTAELVLGADDTGWSKYSVQIASFTPPGQPGGAPGSIQAVVTITPVDGPIGSNDPPPTGQTPEPASLLLAGLGLPLVVLVRRRMKKNA